MTFLHTVLRIYPYWSIPAALICIELGVVLKRRHVKLFWIPMVLGVLFLATCVLWIVNRGDLHSDLWIKKNF